MSAKVAQVGQGHEAHADHREHRFGQSMADCYGRGHEREAQTADDKRSDPSMAQDAESERDNADGECQGETDPVDGGRQQCFTPQAERTDEENAQNAMHGTQAAQENPGTVKPITNRGYGAAHGVGDM